MKQDQNQNQNHHYHWLPQMNRKIQSPFPFLHQFHNQLLVTS
uniref:Squamosa promoter-binding-like protein 2 n=1 Tax=Rhizophora mucronata TaxID=61149 RepID=A0A2P2R4M1_RHIMU